MKTYNYGIIGPGRIATSYCKAIQRCERVRIHGVASRDSQRAKDFANQFGASKTYNSYEAIAQDPDIDVIYIATPHAFHAEQALICLQNKKPVVCEKPLTLNRAAAKTLIEASHANNTFLLEGMWSRFNPAVRMAKELVEAGTIGEVRHITADFGFKKEYDAKSRLYDLKLGGGSILDVGVYPLFLALFILGKPDEIKTVAHLAPTGADTSCGFTLSYKYGATAQLFSSMIVETRKDAEICGTKGSIVIQTPWYKSMGLIVAKEGQPEERIALPYPGNGFEFQIDEVTKCLDNGQIESTLMTHDFTLLKAQVSDEILKQAGVKYS
ncbi:MAG TPA: Gfo/Idh/MocA family oxidoreductase [Cyclobacteriaceae bacterium]|nr:Gfo/Idh/MocA family oxidoreductase [Cyclobacteriaceae bacterium]